ncbi:hypothetical protein [Rhizobium skierniewicense]|uniref:hypothetical protein n=1 Tax=Rhizobium skierniewicense TaxID=984260 RepID=UPI0015742923|nr:hypothetical protein [Rhizobium skierniewicense]NTF31221.1 hypothetical protein [Rhizobium skierniewicense]
MNDHKESTLTSFTTSKPVVIIAAFGALPLLACIVMLGAQLAFLVQLPRLSQLIGNWQAMWLVFSTWPDFRFGLSFAMAYFIHLTVAGLSRKPLSVAAFRERLQNMDRRHLVAAIGITIFALPLLLAAGMTLIFALMPLTLFAVVFVLMVRSAARIGVPFVMRVGVAALSIGFFGNLMMPSLSDDHFECRRGFVELRSGEKMLCDGITVFSSKPLFLIENSNDAQLVRRRDLAFENVLEASQHFPAGDGAGAK